MSQKKESLITERVLSFLQQKVNFDTKEDVANNKTSFNYINQAFKEMKYNRSKVKI